MKNWKLAYKITVIDCAIIAVIGILVAAFTCKTAEDFGFALGIICLIGGGLNLLLGVLALIAGSGESKQWGKGFLNSAGILLLLSGISCGTAFSA